MTTKYCGIFRVFTKEKHSGMTWMYNYADSITQAKKFFLTYQESENNECESFGNDRRIELVHIANSEYLYGIELLEQYKEELGC